MPIQLRGYSVPQMGGQQVDPMQTIGGIMNVMSGMEHLEGQRAERERYEQETARFNRLNTAMAAAGGNPHEAVRFLESAGDYATARDVRKSINEQIAQTMKMRQEEFKAGQERLKWGTGILQGLDGADDDVVVQHWPTARRALLEEFGNELGPYAGSIPDAHADPEAIRGFVEYAYPMGLEASDSLSRRNSAMESTADRLRNAKTQVEVDEALAEGFASYAPTLDPQEWGAAVGELEQAGMSPRMLGMIGSYAERPALRQRLGLKGPIVEPGSLEHEFNSQARELGVTVDQLTEGQRHRIRRNYYASTRKPDSPDAGQRDDITRGTYNAAVRWRRSEKAKVEDMFVDEDTKRRLRREIDEDYYRQLGVAFPGTEVWSQVENVLQSNGYEPTEDNMIRFMLNNKRELGL